MPHHYTPHPHPLHNAHHNAHHPPATASSSGGGITLSTSDGGSTEDAHPRLYPLKCGALTPNYPSSTNDSGDSDDQPYPLPWYANRKAKQLTQKRTRAVAPSSNGCGTIIHNASSRSERAWIARGPPTDAVVPLAREFFNQPDAKDGRMPCGCEWHGVGCCHCGAPLGEVFYPCPKHNRHGDSLPMFTFDMAYVTALGAPNTTNTTSTTTTSTTPDDLSTPPSPLSPSSHSSSVRTLRIDHPPSPRISTRHPPIVVSATPNNPYVPTGAFPSTLPSVAGARPVIMARTHHPAQRPPPLPRPHRSPSCPGTPHDSEEDSSGSEEEITGASGSGGSYSDESLPMTAGHNPTPSPPRSNSQSSLQSC